MTTDRHSHLRLVGCVAVAVFMARLDIYVVNISLPAIARHFHADTSAVSWVTMSYLLFNCGAMMLIGRIADTVSSRTLFIWGYAIFTAGSLFCGLATSLGMLVFFRCVQGLGGSILVIMTYAAVSRFLPAAKVGGAMGILAMCGALGVAMGSPLGGFLTERLSWQWVFFVNVPIGVLAILLASWTIPGGMGAGKRMGKLDYLGTMLSILGVVSFILALNVGQKEGWDSPPFPALLALSAVSGWLFVARQLKAKDPLIAPSLLKERRFLLANAVSVSGLILMGGNAFLMPFFLELVKSLSTERAGLVLMVYSVTFMILSPLAGRLADRFAPWRLCVAGMGVAAAGCFLFTRTLGAPGLASVVIFLVGIALAYALFMAANAKQVLSSAPMEQKGSASAVFGMLCNLSLLIGVNIFETFYAETGVTPGSATPLAPDAGQWVPGFSHAYLFGACACLVSLLLAFGIPFFGKGAEKPANR
ncbi:MAG: DHA2 family efflux MFS transporter permease subunit [Verrucomicrobiia bacterium]|jgi:EmrB/QacA subfamily drug resistance transporter